MKRAVILLISLFALSLAGCACASALVNSAQDKAHFEPETLAGDPELCEGVSVRANTSDVAEFSNRLYFELGFDAASGETRERLQPQLHRPARALHPALALPDTQHERCGYRAAAAHAVRRGQDPGGRRV